MTDAELLEKAIGIAVQAHRGQTDRHGAPYVLHPLRVMHKLQTTEAKIVAVLHDVVEDTTWSFDDLTREGFPEHIVEAVRCLTKIQGEPYDRLIDRAALNPLARSVKIADLEDNMDLRRFEKLAEKDQERLTRYLRAWRHLAVSG